MIFSREKFNKYVYPKESFFNFGRLLVLLRFAKNQAVIVIQNEDLTLP